MTAGLRQREIQQATVAQLHEQEDVRALMSQIEVLHHVSTTMHGALLQSMNLVHQLMTHVVLSHGCVV
jgi:hypothetical protein